MTEKFNVRKHHLKKCWELMRCQMENECSAYPECGHKCWEVAGTMRCTQAERRLDKLRRVALSEGRDLTEQQLAVYKPMTPKKLCKYIERYGTCRCCPYYQYMEQMGKATSGAGGDAF